MNKHFAAGMALTLLALCAHGQSAPGLPKDVDIIRISPQDFANNWFRDGLRPVEDQGGNCGYLDARGNQVVPYIYDGADEMAEGLGIVYKGDRQGAIDSTGNLVIPLIYKRLSSFDHGIAIAALDTKFGLINKTGDVVIPFLYDSIDDRINFQVTGNGTPGPSLDSLVKVSVKEARKGSTGTKYGYINLRGQTVVPIEFDKLGYFKEGLAWFARAGKYGFVDTRGSIRIEATYDDAREFSEGLAAVKKGGTWGFIDQSGKMAIAFAYDAVPPDDYYAQAGFVDGVAVVGRGWYSDIEPYWGYIDRTGRELTKFEYYTAHPVSEGMMGVTIWSDTHDNAFFLAKNGKVAISQKYMYTGSFSHGRARVVTQVASSDRRQNQIGYVDPAGKLVIPMKYTISSDFDGSGTVPGYARVSTSFVSITGQVHDPRFTTIDRDGKTVKPYGFDSISDFKRGIAVAYDITGNKVLAFIVDRSWKAPQAVPGTQDLRYPPGTTRLLVDGKSVDLESYTVSGSDYVKPRDLALALAGSAARFNVSWDEARQAFVLQNGKAPDSAGSPKEGTGGKAARSAQAARPSSARVYLDGFILDRVVPLSIAGEVHVNLDRVLNALGVKLSRDDKSQSLRLDTGAAGRSVFRIVPRVNEQYAISISGGSKESGAKAVTWDNDYTANVQDFAFVPAGDKFSIVSLYSGKALTAENKKGAPLTLETYTGSPGQLFRVEDLPRGYISLVSSFGYYLGVSGGSSKQGSSIITWDKTGNSSQHFRLTRLE